MIGQKRKHSFIESLVNVAIGYSVALVSQLVVFQIYDIDISLKTNLWIGIWFTGISIMRSYVIRRWFNKKMLNK